jgi:DNA helicase-2/ATP-dependent DNA helicase PcrA
MAISELIPEMLNKTGYTQSLKNENTIEAESRIENLEELITVAMEFEKEEADNSLIEFLNSISLSSDTDNLEETDDMITLMTLHSAKGLEYPVVFLVGLEEGIFPGFQSIGEPGEIEEERRLAYVGITRAKRFLYLTCAKHRTIFGSTSYNKVSRFVQEIPPSMLDGYTEEEPEDNFEDSSYRWEYGEGRRQKDYSYDRIAASPDAPYSTSSSTTFQFRSADSFLASLNKKVDTSNIDFSKYVAGAKVFHKKFGEGVINYVESEGEDLKVDINFEKAGHKRLMAKFAGLEIIE